jgi:hypothetical protein
MATIKIETSALSQTTAQWLNDAPTEHGAPPVPTAPPTDPISAGVIAAIADWPGVHGTLLARRTAAAGQFAVAVCGDASILDAVENGNVALITNSGSKD